MIPWIGDKEHLDTEYEILEICSNKVNGMKVGWRLGKLRITYVVYPCPLCARCRRSVLPKECIICISFRKTSNGKYRKILICG